MSARVPSRSLGRVRRVRATVGPRGPEEFGMLGRRAALIGLATALSGVVTGPLLLGCLTVAAAPAAQGPPPEERQDRVLRRSWPGLPALHDQTQRRWLSPAHERRSRGITPDWSPNGNRLAFELFQLSDGEHAGVAIMNADGSDLVDLTPTGIQAEPAWTPDGQQLVYECFTCAGGDGIFVINDDGTGPRRLTHNPFPDGFDTDPNVSPDGQTVTFVRVRKDGRSRRCSRSTSTADTAQAHLLRVAGRGEA